MGRNMGGLHIEVVGSHNGYGDYLRLCAEAGKPVSMVKAFFDGGVLMEAKKVNSQTITIWRGRPLEIDEDNPHQELDWLWRPDQNEQFANEWMTALLDRWKNDRGVTDYLEIVNEPNGGGNPLQFENQRDFFIECMKWADGHNFKIAIGSFSSGCPTEWQTQILAPSFDYAARHDHIVALHDGSVDEDRPLFAQAAQDGTAYRYRMYNRVLDSMGLMRPKYAITEGYRPSDYRGMNMANWSDMQTYLMELAHDGVLGWAWFTLGDYNFGGGSVNIVGQLPRYRDMLIATEWPDAITPTPMPSNSTVLDIKYFDQNNKVSANDSSSDCGAACLAMLLASRGLDVTVNQVFARTGAVPGQPISFAQMKTAAATYGNLYLEDRRGATLDDLQALLRDKIAPILLVNASLLNQPGKVNKYLGAHYVVLVGITLDGFLVHDPNGLPATIEPNLAAAWGNCHLQGNPDFAMLVLREGVASPPIVGAAWRGLQLRNGENTAADFACIIDGKLNAAKMTTDTAFEDLDFLCTLVSPEHILLRLFADLSDRVVGPVEFASWFGLWLAKFASVGGKYVEVHNEPNLYAEGLGKSWIDGTSFALWLLVVLNELRQWQPSLKYGFPGLSPGGSIANVRMDETQFYTAAKYAINKCDWIGVHCYWLGDTGMISDADGGHYRAYKNEGKPLMITEFSNPNPVMPKADKGRQYKAYYPTLPGYVIAAYSFISSSDNPAFASETWAGTEIPGIVRSDLI